MCSVEHLGQRPHSQPSIVRAVADSWHLVVPPQPQQARAVSFLLPKSAFHKFMKMKRDDVASSVSNDG